MREVVIRIVCDCCGDDYEEDYEGQSTVTFTIRNDLREMELCDQCISGSFLQNARRAEPPKEYDCVDCEAAFATKRGLNHHRTRAHKKG